MHLITALDFELSCGGMLQWLINQTGGYVVETIGALLEIGTVESARRLAQILSTFPSAKIPTDELERAKLVNELAPAMFLRWREIANAVLDWPEDTHTLLERFVAEEGKST